MKAAHKLPTVDHIDKYISAEIPDKNEDPELYSLVREFMIHGPCGEKFKRCPCMIDNKCSKNFPRKFKEETSIDTDGFPVYRRRNNGSFVEKSGEQLDNRNVVPYNKVLLKRYQAHINVEWCNQAGSIKYLFKYINKGADRVTLNVIQSKKVPGEDVVVDEIKHHCDCRYLSACEATWRIFQYDIHYRTPPVMRLPFHLPGQQKVVFGANDDLDDVLQKPSVASSMFLGWMEKNKDDPNARELSYIEFPSKYVWKQKERCWEERQRVKSIGRIHSVPASVGEGYFLRILLNKVKGPTSFEDILTVDGKLQNSFRDACYAMGLLDDDSEYIAAIKEAAFVGSGEHLRKLFATLLASNSLSRPDIVWDETWKDLSDDIAYNKKKDLDRQGTYYF